MKFIASRNPAGIAYSMVCALSDSAKARRLKMSLHSELSKTSLS
ncbi:MAG TPA: hypothetical protein PLI74_12030 [Candidatus Kapabacteria bacterium]|nr:hypothetical protein [Candidatus Kapabacteria bacterium]HRK60364.1 hypothetical protein [Candidatus Kapabacteria bacterium]